MVPYGYLKKTSESALGDGIFSVGTQIEFECDVKYELVGSRLSSCLKTGQWDNFFPVCVLSKLLQKMLFRMNLVFKY